MSASKLLKRILASEDIKERSDDVITLKHLHEHTFGIANDPLCQFAVVFSALIHDVGHPGVPNKQFATEDTAAAEKYKHRSIAERRSLDVAFGLLQLSRFKNLRKCIYTTELECKRFRQLVVNCILATDIADKDLKTLRDNRWNAAFHFHHTDSSTDKRMDIKATIVIEHLIQASDVAHTMQHFVIFQRWNERLFQELYFAYLAGRIEKDPALCWYKDEIWFFDNYIIPLAKKLKDCGVFGVSSDEYLHHAEQNRYEWEQKGHQIVDAMKKRADTLKSTDTPHRATRSKGSNSKTSTKDHATSFVEF
jgi:3'5'-cyclic nucleotide phosphodiesterase